MIWSGNISPFLALLSERLDYKEGISNNQTPSDLKAFFFFDEQPGKESMIKRRHIVEAERWAQLDMEGGRPGRRVWMIFGFGEIFGSSSSSMSLSHTCTTTLGVDSVPAWSSYFSPEKWEERGGGGCEKQVLWWGWLRQWEEFTVSGNLGFYLGITGGFGKWNEIYQSWYPRLTTYQLQDWAGHSASHGHRSSTVSVNMAASPRGLWWGRNGSSSALLLIAV